MNDFLIISRLKKSIRLLASLKIAIPLLVLLTAVTVIGSLFPNPDLFSTWWYLSLLGLQGVSLLLVTIQHIPAILKKKGRNALIGVITIRHSDLDRGNHLRRLQRFPARN